MDLKLNETYVVLFEYDDFCCRCRIERFLNDDEVIVRLIDLGEVRSAKRSSLRELTDTLKAPISALARKMLIPMKFVDNFTIDDLDLCSKGQQKVCIIDINDTHFVVDLFKEGVSMIVDQ